MKEIICLPLLMKSYLLDLHCKYAHLASIVYKETISIFFSVKLGFPGHALDYMLNHKKIFDQKLYECTSNIF